MTKEELIQNAKAMIAFANGGEVEFYSKSTRRWMDAKHPSWNAGLKYRPKPKTKRVPFTFETLREYLTTANHPVFVEKISKDQKTVAAITQFHENVIYLNDIPCTYEEVFNKYNYIGTDIPFGTLEEYEVHYDI